MQTKDVIHDLLIIKQILGISDSLLAKELGISRSTLNRWVTGESTASQSKVQSLYTYAYKRNVSINLIKSQLYQDDYSKKESKVIFHGSKYGIEGPIDLTKTNVKNDFGRGFYCDEKYSQAAMFVSSNSTPYVYILSFNQKNLKGVKFDVDTKWLIAIAYYRGRLEEYKNSDIIKQIVADVSSADYLIAPIADNKMFSIIDNFIDGDITDEACKHALSASDLGYQYVLLSQKSINSCKILSTCYLCDEEREKYHNSRIESMKEGNDKVKASRIQYRNIGKYIDELLKGGE